MSEHRIQVEEFDNGLRAAFVNMPHFRTTSARLTINSGSLHESPDTAGAAHFLEHINFQGTKDLPTDVHVHRYVENNGLSRNACTSKTDTSYTVDGYDLETVGHLVTQLALFPLLEREALEKERKPIADELRGRASNPAFYADVEHSRALRGDEYAKPVIGTAEDIEKMTHENLTAYYARNYRLGNAVLVMCSGEPVEKQREYMLSLLDTVADDSPTEPTAVKLSGFNPDNLHASLQSVDLPPEAQTSVVINYGLPEVRNLHERYVYSFLGVALSKAAHRRLRGELALCYHAQAGAYRLDNLHFGADDNWGHLRMSANCNGADSIPVLDAMLDDVLSQELPESAYETLMKGLHRSIDDDLESNPAGMANTIKSILAQTRQDEVDLEASKAFADKISLDEVRNIQRNIIDTAPLVTATSPDPAVLERIGEWATSRKQR